MIELYLFLLVVSALCLAGAALGVKARVDLLATGLLFWVAVGLIQTARVVF